MRFSAQNFHLPSDATKPLILVGPGTGIAPFRSFWQHRAALKKVKGELVWSCKSLCPELELKILHRLSIGMINLGPVILFFGCRLKTLDLYREEKQKMVEERVIDEVHLALSREPGTKKVSSLLSDSIGAVCVRSFRNILTRCRRLTFKI